MSDPPARFLAMRLRLAANGAQLEWVGRRTRWAPLAVDLPVPLAPTPIDGDISACLLPEDFDPIAEAALQSRLVQYPLVPLPVFLAFPDRFAGFAWDAWLFQLLQLRLAARVPGVQDLATVVRLAPGPWRPREAPSLPLRIAACGAAAQHAVSLFSTEPWYQTDAMVQSQGIEIIRHPALVSTSMLEQRPDIVLVAGTDFSWLHAVIRTLAPDERPRLIIGVETPDGDFVEPPPPPGVAQLALPRRAAAVGAGLLCKALLLAIVHDQPLHAAVAIAEQQFGIARTTLRLTANPRTNQSLRLSDMIGALTDQAAELPVFEPLHIDAAFSVAALPLIAPALRLDIADISASLRSTVNDARHVFDFQHERGALVPASGVTGGLATARQNVGRLHRLLNQAAGTRDNLFVLARTQQRRVDLAMRQLEREATDPAGYVQPGTVLAANARYRLRVRIGERAPESLMLDTPPTLDPLLVAPDDAAGYQLQVVVYPIDFGLEGAAVRPLALPLEGASDTAFFTVTTPPRSGSARLRLAVYHANHMLQSFLLTAWIGPNPAPDDHPPLGFSLVFSRTARFANLPELSERAFNIAVNDATGATGSHGLHIKGEGDAVARISLTEGIMSRQMDAYRDILRQATLDAQGNPRFLTYPEPSTPITAGFHQVARDLALYGHGLYRALFTRGERALGAQLRQLAAQRDKTIQIVRFDPNFVFPWSVIYDFPLPAMKPGDPPPEMCRGVIRQPDGSETPCNHTAEAEAYCINGFWGVRHVIEELVAIVERDAMDAVTAVTRPTRDGAIRLAIDQEEPHTREMRERLAQQLGSGFAPIERSEDLLDLLWQPDKRPAVLILLGHVQMAGDTPRITLPGGQRGLSADEILDRVARGEWGQPCTLVLLMGCDTAMIDIGTLSGFVQALNSAGAGAVVGTECIAFSRLLSRFATEVTLALWQPGARLGEAVTRFRRDLLRAGNPLAFIFQVLGTADLHLVWTASP